MEKLTKQEWITIVQWLKLRFTSLKWSDNDIRSLYDDFKMYDGELVWEACNLLYDNNTEFMSASKLKSLVHELFINTPKQDEKLLPMGEVMRRNKGGLIEYLKANGYESFAHAVWDATVKRHKSGNIPKYERHLKIDVDEPWETAKNSFLQTFKLEWKIEHLEQRRRDREYGNK